MNKENIIKVINKLLDLNEELANYNKTLIKDKEKRKSINKWIKQIEKAREYLPKIKHDRLLVSIFNNIFVGKEAVFTFAPSLINHKKTKYFDTEKGFKDFLKLEVLALEEEKKKAEENRKRLENIAKAKAEGKDIEYVYKDGKMQQVIVDKGNN